MKRILNILIFLTVGAMGFNLHSCAVLVDSDPYLEPYVRMFEMTSEGKITKEDTKHINITFKSLGTTTIGRCYFGSGTVEINPVYWFSGIDVIEKMALVHHELGHCVCYKFHTDDLLTDGCPASIMHSNAGDKACYYKHWKHYMKELYEDC